MDRWIPALGGVVIVVGGIVMLYPTIVPQWVGIPLIMVGTLTVAYAIWGKNRPKPSYWGVWVADSWYWNWRIRIDVKGYPVTRLTPLKRAANNAYQKTRNSTAAAAAERSWGGNQAKPAQWYATALIGKTQDSVRVYGARPSLKGIKPIAASLIRGAHFADNLEDLLENGSNRVLYSNLKVSNCDVRRRTKEIANWGSE